MNIKNTILILLITVVATTMTAQNNIIFEQIDMTNSTAGVKVGSIAFSDVDNDGDEDVLITGKDESFNSIAKLYINIGMMKFVEVVGTPFAGVGWSSIAFTDVDNDGDEDVLITGVDQTNVKIAKLYFNDGLGNFTEVIGTPFVGVNTGSIAFSDVDNDGDEDVLITGNDALINSVISKLYINDGLGNFTEVIGTPFVGVYYSSIAFSDVDNDGDEDVLITGKDLSGNLNTKLYENDGLGNFTEVIGTPFVGVNTGSIAFSDVDNDGDEDVLITGVDQTNVKIAKLYFNDGLGIFTEMIGTPFVGVDFSSIAFSDVDNDGDEDVLITGRTINNIYISKLYTNYGTGNFTEVIGTPFVGVKFSAIVFSDVDNDGDEEVLITGTDQANNPIVKLYTPDGLGNFIVVNVNPFDVVDHSSIAFTDVDNDGDEDVLITGYDGQSFISKLYKNDGLGIFTEVIGTPFVGVNAGSIAFSDVDNDGDEDVLITGYDGQLRISKLYTNDGLGIFTEIIGTPFVEVVNSSIAFSDVDNDGDEDVLITGVDQTNVKIAKLYFNDGLGIFTEMIGTPFVGVDFSSIAFSDVDNDGDEDVLITGNDGLINSVISKLYINDGLGNFTEVIGTPFVGVYYSSIAFSDVDNDGDEDVLITGSVGNSHISKLYENDGLGNFTEIIGTPFVEVVNSSIAFSDVDNDGDEDVLITGYDGQSGISKLYENDGLGVFTEVIGTPFVGVYYSSIAFTDVDNDGDEDVLITGWDAPFGNGTANLYRNLYHLGCTDLLACNYDPTAALDDSSCVYTNTTSANIVTCNSYLWNGIVYIQSGTYDSTFINMNGCDSVATLVLTINNATTSADVQTACNSYTWIDGVTYTASNSTATYTTTNANSCDSVITLDLTIFNSNSSAATETACNTYFWNGTTYTSSGTYDTTIINSVGCDSVASLNLTITGNPVATIVQNGIDLEVTSATSYNWNTSATTQTITPTTNGTYWCIVTDANGCISDTSFFDVINIVNGLNEVVNTNRNLLKVVDELGRDVNPDKVIDKTTLFYIYDDGTVEKRIVIE